MTSMTMIEAIRDAHMIAMEQDDLRAIVTLRQLRETCAIVVSIENELVERPADNALGHVDQAGEGRHEHDPVRRPDQGMLQGDRRAQRDPQVAQ